MLLTFGRFAGALVEWAAEIKLRATVRIGEISRELEKVVPVRGRFPTGGKPKAAVLNAAGISTSAAHRAEKLAAFPVGALSVSAFFGR